MQRQWLYLIIIGQIWAFVGCKSYYSILAPGTVKSNRNYTVSVTLHDGDGPAIIRVGLLRLPALFSFQDVSLQPLETKSINFVLPKLSLNYKYELVAEGILGINFKNSSELLVDPRNSLKIYLQTSKGIYKPGDLVQFRVIILNEHLKPVKLDEPVGVHIQDSKDHRVKQIKNISLIKGIFSGSIQLTDQPNLGIWKIVVSISGKYDLKETKPFKVAKYVLPKFSVYIDTVDDFIHEDELLPVTIYGKYVYGKYVEGLATIKIMIERRVFETQTKLIEDCKAKFVINATKYLTFSEVQPIFVVEATLTDQLTNVSLTARKAIHHHNQRYKIVVPTEEIEFRDNRPYLIKAKVRYLNDTEVFDRSTPLFMKHGSKLYRELLDDHGTASFLFDYEQDKSSDFFFKKTSLHLSNIFFSTDLTDDYFCNLKVKSGKIQMGLVVEVEVSSKSYIPYLVYVVMAHGNIIYSQHIQLETDQNSYTIRLLPTIEMMPSAKLSVHYILQGQLYYCDIKLSFPNEFENKITVSTTKTIAQPGQEIKLNIQAQPNSRVGLLALDLSAHLLNANYSLNKNAIFNELLYDQAYAPFGSLRFGQQSGLVILSNAGDIKTTQTVISGYQRRIPKKRNAMYSNAPIRVRTKFPETWIFQEIETDNENTTMSLQVPDTITTWLITAISVNEKSGFGITDEAFNITVFRSFFISTNLPYSIKRGEVMAIPLTIFNYYEESLSCVVVMNNTDGEFQFVGDEGKTLDSRQIERHVNISANSGASVKYLVKALKLGQLNIRLTAYSSIDSDAIHEQLIVEPEGILVLDNEEIYLNLPEGTVQKSLITAEIPQGIVEKSEFLKLFVGGDILVPSLENLQHLVILPTGCGEQNMINFAPNILVLDYLKSINKWQKFPELVVQALSFIETGYQRELTYRHNTGGYSVFGVEDTESVWLTAYVVRFFIKAVRYVAVESEIITSGLDFLALKQQTSGEFLNSGYIFFPAHQNRYGFTAFVLLSFMENRKYSKQYKHIIQKGVEFLAQNINSTNDAYALSIMATALQNSENESESSLVRNRLLALQQNEGNKKWWNSSQNGHSNDVEITSYALMSLLETNGIEHMSIFRWLIEQRNADGGFSTTHNTVVGLQALIKFSEKYNGLSDNVAMNITFSARDQQGLEVENGTFEITEENFMILQQQQLPHSTRSVQYEATGRGTSLLQLSYQYYVAENKSDFSRNEEANEDLSISTEKFHISNKEIGMEVKKKRKQQRSLARDQSFIIEPLAKMSSTSEMLMEICFKYQPFGNLRLQKTNMIILEIHLPSGFVCNSKTTEELLAEELVTKVELQNSDSKIIIYFDQLKANDEQCLQIRAEKVYEVQQLRSSTIEIYDYYNLDLRNIVLYEINN